MFTCCFVIFFVEASFILASMIEDVKEDMRPLQVENGKGTVEDFRQKLFDFMDLYSGIRELSKRKFGTSRNQTDSNIQITHFPQDRQQFCGNS